MEHETPFARPDRPQAPLRGSNTRLPALFPASCRLSYLRSQFRVTGLPGRLAVRWLRKLKWYGPEPTPRSGRTRSDDQWAWTWALAEGRGRPGVRRIAAI